MDSGLADPMFNQGDDPIDCLNKEGRQGWLNVISVKVKVTWLEKLMLAKAQKAGQILDEEQLAFIADLGIVEVQVAQQKIPQNSAFQTEDLDAYDSDCDDISSSKVHLMENLLSCDPGVLSEVRYFDSYLNDMINQDV
nr:hypothetical protein [Tanacetum cinerariifolium]